MANSVVHGGQSEPAQYAGTIHFRGQCAYLENMDQSDWSLIQFDWSFTGVVDPAVAATTASTLQTSYKEGDQVTLHGVFSDQSFDVVSFYVLFVC
jgi:hypothetical protein